MAVDPYGYREENVERPPPGGGGCAAISSLAWLCLSILTCATCSGAMFFGEPDPGDQWYDQVGVWLLLISPAWMLAGIGAATAFLHRVARRWWTSVGPNLVIGGCGGCLLWGMLFFAWVVFAVVMDG